MLLDYRSQPEIPDGWSVQPIERLIMDIGDGGTPSRDDAGNFGGGVAWAVIDDIDKNITSTRETLTVRGVSNSNAKIWPAGSVIVSTGATIGRVGIARVPLATKQGITGIVPNEELIDADYLAAVLRSGTSVLERFAQGSTFKEIRPPTLVKLRMRVPPVHEQSRIALVLDTLDEATAKTEAVIAKLKQVRAGLLHDLLTRGLDEHGQLRDPVAHPEQFKDSPLGRIPSKWLYEPLSKHTISSAYGPRFSGERYSERGNVALLRTTDMDETGNLVLEQMPLADLVLEEFRQHFLEPLDFLISRSGTCGIGAVFPGFRVPVLPGAFLIRFRLTPSLVPDFLRLYVNSEIGARRIRDLAEGGVQKNIRGSKLLAHLVPVPPAAEQQRILRVVRTFDAASKAEESQLAKLHQLKSGLMNDLLTGRVRVPENIMDGGGHT